MRFSASYDAKSSWVVLAISAFVCISMFHFLYVSRKEFSPYIQLPISTPPLPPVTLSSPKAGKGFPRKLWQTAKTSPASLNEDDRRAIQSWAKMNQKWRYEIITQYSAETYVQEVFWNRPDIVEVFTDLQDPILRADLVRYLVLLGDGGVYSDLDTRALKPIEDWVPAGYRDKVNVVIGVEYDRLDGGRWVDWTLDLQFCTWTIMSKPGHPLLELTVDHVIKGLKKLALRQGTTISEVKPSRGDVLDTTGPAIFTRSVFELLSQSTATNFTWMNVTKLTLPRLMDDVLIMPINSFGSGQSHSNSGSPTNDNALVEHMFRGSWKEDHLMEERPKENDASEKEQSMDDKTPTADEIKDRLSTPEDKENPSKTDLRDATRFDRRTEQAD